MKLKLLRTTFTDNSTIGELYLNDMFECFTLEDVVRNEKIPGETAIPASIYEVIINHSNRFDKLMPLLLNVPYFEGIRIHSGNTDADTEGCILVGTTKDVDFVGNSKTAYNTLFPKLQTAFNKKEKIMIEIIDVMEKIEDC